MVDSLRPAGLPRSNQWGVVVSRPTDSTLVPYSPVKILSGSSTTSQGKLLVEADGRYVNPNDLIYKVFQPFPEWFEKAIFGKVVEHKTGFNPYKIGRSEMRALCIGPARRIFNSLVSSLKDEPVQAVRTLVEDMDFDRVVLIDLSSDHSKELLEEFHRSLSLTESPHDSLGVILRRRRVSESYLRYFLSKAGYDVYTAPLIEGKSYTLSDGTQIEVLRREKYNELPYHFVTYLDYGCLSEHTCIEEEISWKVVSLVSRGDREARRINLHSELDGNRVKNLQMLVETAKKRLHSSGVGLELNEERGSVAVNYTHGSRNTASQVVQWLVDHGCRICDTQ